MMTDELTLRETIIDECASICPVAVSPFAAEQTCENTGFYAGLEACELAIRALANGEVG